MRKLNIGVASYRNPQKLDAALRSIEQKSTTDWRCFIIHNPSEGEDDAKAGEVIREACARNERFVALWQSQNRGYAGAVNALFRRATTEYLAYLDNDAEVLVAGWDEQLCFYLDRFHEIGMIFPNGGAYQIPRGSYQEVMWGVGFCWAVNRLAMADTGEFDESLGHQEEADYALRLRMAGWKCAAAPEIRVAHNATATNDPAAVERINRGVVAFVNKWCRYFGGKNLNYHSPNVLRWEDWPPNALYLEEYWKQRLPQLNSNPSVVVLDGRQYDLISVPRLKDFYGGRII
jgi:GT2 family glycosyltransferase